MSLLCTAAAADVWHVDGDNLSGTENGLSWATAYTTVQEGIDAAYADAGGEVWVAEGVYDEHRSSPTGSVLMKQNVHLYGGFAGTESARGARDWIEHKSVLDGSKARSGESAYHVLIGADDATLDGFVITGGLASETDEFDSPESKGGGLYNDSVSPVVRNCVFRLNTAWSKGGAIYNSANSVELSDCTFAGNVALEGGGVYCQDRARATLTRCVFHGNYAGWHHEANLFPLPGPAALCAGGLHTFLSEYVDVRDCAFSGNTSSRGAGAYVGADDIAFSCCTFSGNLGGSGGGLTIGDVPWHVDQCAFTNNETHFGAAGLYAERYSNGQADRCAFVGNRCETFAYNSHPKGGGALIGGARTQSLTRCIFIGNYAQFQGGGFWAGPNTSVQNCLFLGNRTEKGGGAIGSGGLSEVINCTFFFNATGSMGGGAITTEPSGTPYSPVSVANSIVWGNTAPEIDAYAGIPVFASHSDVWTDTDPYPGEGNIREDPQFSSTSDLNLRLDSTSPCVDTGTSSGAPVDDLVGTSRPQGGGVDMGAFERGASDRYMLVLGVEGAGRTEPSGTALFDDGAPATITAIPSPGFTFQHWQAAGETLSANPLVITINKDQTLTAVFSSIPVCQLAMHVQGRGTTYPTAEESALAIHFYPGPYALRQGSRIMVYAGSDLYPGWRFSRWTGAVETVANPAVVLIPSSAEAAVTAVFREGDDRTLLTAVEGEGTITPAPGPHYYADGTIVTLTATPDPGHGFLGWEGDASGTQSPLDISMDDNKMVTAVFAASRTLTTAVDGGGTIDPPVGSHPVFDGDEVEVTATANPGWAFDHWEGALAGSQNPTTLVVSGDMSVTAVFGKTVALTIAIEGEGTTNPFPGYHVYSENTSVTIVAIPSEGWVFDHWEGAIAGSESPAMVTMDTDKTITAVFAEAHLGWIEGTATDVHLGEPIIGAQVSVTGLGGTRSTTTDDDGVYVVTGLYPTTYTVQASANGFGQDSREATVPNGAGTTVDLQLALLDPPVLSVSPLVALASSAAGTATFSVQNLGPAGFTYSAEVIEGAAWFRIESGATGRNGDVITTHHEENTLEESRYGRIRVTSPGADNSPFYVMVFQEGVDTEPCDVNDDGVVNAVDVQLVINSALGAAASYECDVNGDEKVDALDVQLVINAALGMSG